MVELLADFAVFTQQPNQVGTPAGTLPLAYDYFGTCLQKALKFDVHKTDMQGVPAAVANASLSASYVGQSARELINNYFKIYI